MLQELTCKSLTRRFPPSPRGASCDVLLLLDTCYASCVMEGNDEGLKEVLAASTTYEIAEGDKNSFTRVLAQHLKSTQSFPISTITLDKLLLSKRALAATSFYGQFMSNEKSRTEPIFLGTLRGPVNAGSEVKTKEPTKVLLQVSLNGQPSSGTVKEWTSWLSQNVPDHVTDTRVENIYHSNSILLIALLSI